MNYEIENKIATKFFADCLTILQSKAHDYASSEDCFSNFKTIANVVKLPIEKTFLQFIAVKIARLVELIDANKEAKNESIEDTLKDLSNYACLMSVYLQEKNANSRTI